MHDLFDNPHTPADPVKAAQRLSRTPTRKRFYKIANVASSADGFALMLDGKNVRTPSKRLLIAPDEKIADAISAEWNVQGETIDPVSMPLTRLANSAIDGVADNRAAVASDIAKYFESDLLFYRAEGPERLVARQALHWDGVLRWATDELGARFVLAEGIMHVKQSDEAIAAARIALPDGSRRQDEWRLAALHVATSLTGSALLAIALLKKAQTGEEIFAAGQVDEDWNAEIWGADEEAIKRRVARKRDFDAAAFVLERLG